MKVPIRNFKAATKKERRGSVEIISLMNPDVMREIKELNGQIEESKTQANESPSKSDDRKVQNTNFVLGRSDMEAKDRQVVLNSLDFGPLLQEKKTHQPITIMGAPVQAPDTGFDLVELSSAASKARQKQRSKSIEFKTIYEAEPNAHQNMRGKRPFL